MKKLLLVMLLLLGTFFGGKYYQFKETNKKDEIRKIQLEALQNPEIISTKFKEISELLVYEGEYKISDLLKEENWYSSKSLNIEMYFNYGISIDLQKVEVSKIIEKTVILKIPKNELKIKYVELNTTKQKMNSEVSFFAKQYSPEEVTIITNSLREKARTAINNDKAIFNKSIESLKKSLKNIILKLNYKNIIYEEV